MATIRKKGDYQWHAQIRRKGYPKQTKTFTTRADAEAWAATIESEMARGMFLARDEAESTTLAEAIERYLTEVTTNKKGVVQEKSVLNQIREDRQLAPYALAKIRGADIASYRDRLLKSGLAAATVRRRLAVLSHLFNTARREWGLHALSNPVELVSKPRAERGRERRLSDEEIERIIASTESIELPAIIRLLLASAMRRGEAILGLTWNEIDLHSRVATLQDTKNGERRDVPLSSAAIAALKSIPRRLDGRVFTMTPDAVTRAFARACRRAGIEDARLHDLRHEATSRFFESGKLDLMEVAAITGHKSLQMLKRYTHLKAQDLAKKIG